MSIPTAYYDFIPVDSVRRRRVPEEVFTPRSELRRIYIFEAQLSTVTEVHVGTSFKNVEIGKSRRPTMVLANYRNGAGDLAIPGSSLKGIMSTNYLTLTGSSVLTSELFGSTEDMAIASKVCFSDVTPIEVVKPFLQQVQRAWSPRRRQWNTVKVYVTKAPWTGFYGLAECIPRGVSLSANFQGVGLKDFEVGGLLMCMGLFVANGLRVGNLKLGYGKPQGLGQVQLIPSKSKVSMITFQGLSKTVQSQTLESPETLKYLNAFTEEVKKRDPKRNLLKISETIFKRY